MKIILVLDHAHINGGQAKVAIESALGLADRGHAVTVFAAVAPVDPRFAERGVEVICLDQPDIASATSRMAFAAQALWNRRAETELAALLARSPDALVHVHAFAKALSPSVFRAVARSGLPAVYTSHEFFLVCPNGGFYDYPAAAICHRVPMSLACVTHNCDMRSYPRKVLRVVRHALLDHVARWPEAVRDVILLSDLQADVAGPYLADVTLHRLDNPISVPDLGPKPNLPDRIVYVGRLSTEKGADLFAEAARRAGVRPLFVGDGPEAGALKARYPEAEFLGWRDPAEVIAIIREARALVFPSVWYETHGLTVYEALALGTPVIVSDACAGREGVVDGETGFWFPSGDADGLADRIRRLADDGLARRMGAAAYARYWARPLTLERHVDGLMGIYAAVRARSALPAGSKRSRARLQATDAASAA